MEELEAERPLLVPQSQDLAPTFLGFTLTWVSGSAKIPPHLGQGVEKGISVRLLPGLRREKEGPASQTAQPRGPHRNLVVRYRTDLLPH